MKTLHPLIVIVICAVVIFAWPQWATAQGSAKQKRETQEMKAHLDQLSSRAELIVNEINRRSASLHGDRVTQDSRVAHMAECVPAMAKDLKTMINNSQRLLQSGVFVHDQQLEGDVVGLRVQLAYMTKTIENVMQYLEHMTYKLGQVSSGVSVPDRNSPDQQSEVAVSRIP